MKLIDNSGGIWTNLITRRINPDLVIKRAIIPNEKLVKEMANEAISSIKGSIKHRFKIGRVNGELIFNKFPSGTYEYGILKRKSPDGEDWEELNPLTLKHREFKFKEGKIDQVRGKSFILRETSKHILNGLKIKKIRRKFSGGQTIEIGWDSKNEEIVRLQNDGGSVFDEWFDTFKSSFIPSRPFRGFQKQLRENFRNILEQIRK